MVTNPTDHRALLNYAVLMQGVVKDFDMAEKFYRRALAEVRTVQSGCEAVQSSVV